MPTNGVRRDKGWLAFLDVYGFGHTVSTEDNVSISKNIADLHEFISVHLSDRTDFSLYMFSDSIILFHRSNDQQRAPRLEALADIIRDIQLQGLKHDFLFRGAVIFGDMYLGDGVCIGVPLLRAAKWEEQLALPVVLIPESEIDRSKDVYLKNSTPRVIATKEGVVGGSVILPIPLDSIVGHAERRQQLTLRKGPEKVAAVWCDFLHFLEETRDRRVKPTADDLRSTPIRTRARDDKRAKRRARKRA